MNETSASVEGLSENRAGRRVLVLLVAFAAFLIFKWGHAAAQGKPAAIVVSYPREISRITFAAAGDVIPHQAVTKSAALHDLSSKENQSSIAKESKEPAPTAAPTPTNHGGWDALFAGVADVFR